jgi:hypothetical protein
MNPDYLNKTNISCSRSIWQRAWIPSEPNKSFISDWIYDRIPPIAGR